MSVRLLGIAIPKKDLVYWGLSKIYGIGRTTGKEICGKLTIAPKMTFDDLNESELVSLSNYLSKMTLQNELKRKIQGTILKEVRMNSIRGFKFKYGLPVNGGRRRSNGKTAKKLNPRWLKL